MKGCTEVPQNNRLKSIIPIMSKVIEKLIEIKLWNILVKFIFLTLLNSFSVKSIQP